MVADVVCETEPDSSIRSNETLRGEYIAGAMTQKDLFCLLRESGFINLQVLKRLPYRIVDGHHFYSLTFMARKPEPEKITKMIYRHHDLCRTCFHLAIEATSSPPLLSPINTVHLIGIIILT